MISALILSVMEKAKRCWKKWSLIMNYLHNPIFVGIKEFGICERFDLTSDVFKIDWYGFRKQKTIILDTKKLQNIDKISMSIGCAS